MEEIFKIFEQKWMPFFEGNELIDYEPITNSDMLANPFDYLPEETKLTETEAKELEQIEQNQTGMDGVTFLKMILYRQRLGTAHLDNTYHRKRLNKLKKYCESIDVRLPENFVEFMENPHYHDRIRFQEHFHISEKLFKFPHGKGLFLMPFIIENQGCYFWYLLTDKNGNNCVLYSLDEWHEQVRDEHSQEVQSFEYYICGHSFEDFMIRLSNEMEESEKKYPYDERIRKAEKMYKNSKVSFSKVTPPAIDRK